MKNRVTLYPAEVEHKVYRATLNLSECVESEHPPALISLDDADSPYDDDFSEGPDPAFCIRNQDGQDMSLNQIKNHGDKYLTYFHQRDDQDEDAMRTSAKLLSAILHNKGETLRMLADLSRCTFLKVSERYLDMSQECFVLSREAATQGRHRAHSRISSASTPVSKKLAVILHRKDLNSSDSMLGMTLIQTPKLTIPFLPRSCYGMMIQSPAA